MKVIYTYKDGSTPTFIEGSHNTLRILIVFYDNNKLYVYYCDDSASSIYLNVVTKTTVIDQFLDMSMLTRIESDEEFNYYIKWIEDNYNYNGAHLNEKILGDDLGSSGLINTNGSPLI